MKEEELVKLKAEVYDISVEQDKLMKKYRELNEKKAKLLKRIQGEPIEAN